MGAGHAHFLYWPAASPVHRLPAECKLLAAFAFVLVVVATPRERFWAFAAFAVLLGGAVVLARLPLPLVGRRMLVEVPQPDGTRPVVLPGPPIKLTATPGGVYRRPPRLGEHTAEVLAEVGL